ncbi:30S ribosomal protein S20 [Amphritea sp.]|uniref:30S ribosomal protein S20 n=1 Tax=Amphritea sp. TaxID=1872502 RepID=UPI0025BFCB5F|nr:30S ribosomal protein S20 [Amphritea sp.]
MANSAGSRKRARQAETRRQNNASLRSMVRTYVKKVVTAIESGDHAAATAAFVAAQPLMDGAVTKGIYNKNQVARKKSRMNAAIKKLAA